MPPLKSSPYPILLLLSRDRIAPLVTEDWTRKIDYDRLLADNISVFGTDAVVLEKSAFV
jgi:hypothetical protein